MSSIAEAIKAVALLAIMEPDDAANLRKIQRWFSKTFSTPLQEVETLSTEYILLHYFEEHFVSMDFDDLRKEAVLLLESPEERSDRESKEKTEEDAFIKMIEDEEKAKEKPDPKKLQRGSLKKKDLDIAVNEEFAHKPLKDEELNLQFQELDVKDPFDVSRKK